MIKDPTKTALTLRRVPAGNRPLQPTLNPASYPSYFNQREFALMVKDKGPQYDTLELWQRYCIGRK